MKNKFIFACLPVVALISSCGSDFGALLNPKNKTGASKSEDAIVYGNIITMDETNPTAEGIYIKDGKIEAVGSKEEISKYESSEIKVKTYPSDNYVYPGFVDPHSHYGVMSSIMAGKVFMMEKQKAGQYEMGDMVGYAKEIKKFIDANPNEEFYQVYGMWVMDQTPTAAILDEHAPTDKPITVVGAGGHDIWLNTAAIKKYVGNFEGNEEEKREVAKWIGEVGKDCVITDPRNPNAPAGYFTETARFRITDQIPHSINDIKQNILDIQEASFGKGYTTVGDCTVVENDKNKQVSAFKELRDEGKLELKYRAYYEIREYDSKETRQAELQKAISLMNETKNDPYFQVVGIKVFLDGVFEALSAYTLNDYPQEAMKREGYEGIQRWYGSLKTDLKELVYNANNAGLAMEFHAMGDGAVRQALDVCQYAKEQFAGSVPECFSKNSISHLGKIDSADLGRFAQIGVNAVVAPQWSPATKTAFPNEVKCVGSSAAEDLYPIKSLIDTGANVAFHTDGTYVSAPEMIYNAVTRTSAYIEDIDHARNVSECITGEQSLKCLTINSAKALAGSDKIGVIKAGYDADFTVYNKDYRNNDIAKNLSEFETAQLIDLIFDGKISGSSGGSSLSGGAIAGITVGSAAALALVSYAAFFILWKKGKNVPQFLAKSYESMAKKK